MASQNVVPSDIVKSKGKSREQAGEQANRVEAQSAVAEQADHQSNSGDGQALGSHALQRGFLLSLRYRIELYPDRCGVLHDDGGGDVRSLDGQVIKIIRRSYAQNANKESIPNIGSG